MIWEYKLFIIYLSDIDLISIYEISIKITNFPLFIVIILNIN